MGKRFKCGDLARFVVATHPDEQIHLGRVVEITDDRTSSGFRDGKFEVLCDYWFWDPIDKDETGCRDFQLAPLDPPAEPSSLTRPESIEETA